jgi:hypothetical protein
MRLEVSFAGKKKMRIFFFGKNTSRKHHYAYLLLWKISPTRSKIHHKCEVK